MDNLDRILFICAAAFIVTAISIGVYVIDGLGR